MIQIDLLLRTKRQSIALQISPQGNLIVRAPINCSYEKIQNIIKDKEDWITLHQNRVLNNRKINFDILNYNKVLFCGVAYSVVFIDKIKEVGFYKDCCWVPVKWKDNEDKKIYEISKTLKTQAKKLLSQRMVYFANLMQLEPNTVKFSNSKRTWGLCDKESNIKLNWRVVMLPPDIMDYVIVHELSHMLQLNHSNLFWKVVKSILSNYKESRDLLRKGDYLLELFR